MCLAILFTVTNETIPEQERVGFRMKRGGKYYNVFLEHILMLNVPPSSFACDVCYIQKEMAARLIPAPLLFKLNIFCMVEI